MKRYDEEFKIASAKQVSEYGYSINEVAKRLGVANMTLTNWVKKYSPSKIQSKENIHLQEIKELKKENQRLKMERDILKYP